MDATFIDLIPLHPKTDTLLLFPEAVGLVAGNGVVTDGAEGKVRHASPEDPRVLILRLIDGREPVLMHVMCDGKPYVFRLEFSESPASVITFEDGPGPVRMIPAPPGKAIGANREKQDQVLRLARESSFLRERLPDHYKGFEEKSSMEIRTTGLLATTTHRVCRFKELDCLLLFGEIRNRGTGDIPVGTLRGHVRIAERQPVAPTRMLIDQPVVPAGGTIGFQALLLGDGTGGAGHVDIQNVIALETATSTSP